MIPPKRFDIFPLTGGCSEGLDAFRFLFKKLVLLFERKIRTRLDLLSIPQSGGKTVKTFRWDHRLQIRNLFMAFKRVPLLPSCFSHSAHCLPTRKKLLYTVANPARGLLNRERVTINAEPDDGLSPS